MEVNVSNRDNTVAVGIKQSPPRPRPTPVVHHGESSDSIMAHELDNIDTSDLVALTSSQEENVLLELSNSPASPGFGLNISRQVKPSQH